MFATIQKTMVFPAILVGLVCLCVASTSRGQSCLPANVKPTDIVSIDRNKQGRSFKKTVKDKLKELKARCRNGQLTDARGKQIYFYRLIGCWGNPPQDYLQQLEQQRVALQQLQKKYTVIQMTCDGFDAPVP